MYKNFFLILLVLAISLLLVVSCKKKVEEPALQHEKLEAISGGIVDLSISLLDKRDGINSLVSPVSVSMALAMAANGADGSTEDAFEYFFKGDIDDVNKYYASLISSFESSNSDKLQLDTANKILINGKMKVEKDFIKKSDKYYNSKPEAMNFDAKAIKYVNDWVNKQTRGLIQKILYEFSPDDRVLLVNTLYFKGAWQSVFEENRNTKGKFTSRNGAKSDVTYMFKEDPINIYSDKDLDAVILPYADGRFSMIMLLPNASNKKIKLTSSLMKNVASSKNSIYSQIRIPKFEAEDTLYLKGKLSSLGLDIAFDPERANFSDITKAQRLYISDVLHKTKIIVDEKGTEAAAVTAIMMRTTALRYPEKIINFDRPFVYYIWDHEKNIPLFIGKIEKL